MVNSWCPVHGPFVKTDNGLCVHCGALSVGPGADLAIKLHQTVLRVTDDLGSVSDEVIDFKNEDKTKTTEPPVGFDSARGSFSYGIGEAMRRKSPADILKELDANDKGDDVSWMEWLGDEGVKAVYHLFYYDKHPIEYEEGLNIARNDNRTDWERAAAASYVRALRIEKTR